MPIAGPAPVLGRRSLLLGALSLMACRRGQILSYEAYAQIEHPTPYVLRFSSRGELLFFGSRHTSDPDDPQIAQIEALWRELAPTQAFNEGGDPPVAASREEAVRQYGESGLLRFLAHRDRVPIASIDPDYPAQVAELRARGFSDGQIKLFFVLRQVPQHLARTGEVMPASRLAEVIAFFTEVTAIAGPPNTEAELTAACAQLLPDAPAWHAVPQAWFDPVYERPPSYLNEVSRGLSDFRDRWVVALLVDRVRRGERVFATMGSSHVVVQEPALRARLGRPRRL